MKKILSILLALTLVIAGVLPCFAADNGELYPTIMVAGYSSSSLYNVTEDGTEQVWGVDTDEILSLVLKNIAQIGKGLGEAAFGKADTIADLVGNAIVDMYGVMAYDEYGKSVNNIVPYSQKAADTQYSYLKNNVNGEHMHEPELIATAAEVYNEKTGTDNGYDWCFSFQTDWRQNIVDCAADLDRYIDDVLAFTGAKKVNLLAVSHGGEVCATYLSLYGKDKQVVNNAVLTVPAIGGACLASDLMAENVVFDEETLMYFIENGMMFETDIDWLVKANQLGILDDICNQIMHKYAKQVIGYWGSIWDFISPDYYDELKAQLPDTMLNSELIKKSDYFHYTVYPGLYDSLKECVEGGTDIYVVAGCAEPSVVGLQEYSDGIVTVKSSTGSVTAPYGKRFGDGYVQAGTQCDNPEHNHLSPTMTIDASTGYLPDTTWYVNGLFHGMTWKDDYTKNLCTTLLFSDESMTVYSDENYPQFKYSTNTCHSVIGAFNNSAEGYLSSDDDAFTVTNLSKKYTMKILSVSTSGIDLSFDLKKPVYLKPGESTTLHFNGEIPATSLTTADVTITYKLIGSVTPYGERTLVFTLENGTAPEYTEQYADANHRTAFDDAIDDKGLDILEKTGLYQLFKMIYDMLKSFLRMFGTIC